jgi:hypothetical protein
MNWTCRTYEEVREIHTFFVVKGKIQCGQSRRRLEVNIGADVRQTVCEGVDWVQVTYDRDQ